MKSIAAERWVPYKRYFPVKRMTISLAAAIALVALGATSTFALSNGSHYNSGPTVSVSGNTLTVSGTAAGLGNIGSVDISLTGTANVSSRCYTKSGNKPQAANKQETVDVDQTGTFTARNGSVTFSFSVTPLSTLTCPKGQVVVIESISWNLFLDWLGYDNLDTHLTGSQP
jgi:hypothetical protein